MHQTPKCTTVIAGITEKAKKLFDFQLSSFTHLCITIAPLFNSLHYCFTHCLTHCITVYLPNRYSTHCIIVSLLQYCLICCITGSPYYCLALHIIDYFWLEKMLTVRRHCILLEITKDGISDTLKKSI